MTPFQQDMFFYLVFVSAFLAIVFLFCGVITFFVAPKKISSYVGYRTPLAYRNETSWRFCQRFSGILFSVSFIVYSVAMTIAVVLIYPNYNEHSYLIPLMGIALIAVIMIIVEIVGRQKKIVDNSPLSRPNLFKGETKEISDEN